MALSVFAAFRRLYSTCHRSSSIFKLELIAWLVLLAKFVYCIELHFLQYLCSGGGISESLKFKFGD